MEGPGHASQMLKREAGGREVNEATSDRNTVDNIRKNVVLWRVRVITAAMKT
jgi:hypothetical protein